MLGRLLASEKPAAMTVLPSAKAIAQVRMKPVARLTSVHALISAVERATEGVAVLFSVLLIAFQCSSDWSCAGSPRGAGCVLRNG